ncbi:hypothetical protein CANCADRAFT_122182 [Tortispora caseinolytica NRRL Y-17796]|uniref:FAD-binding FR-type domain-containing protein n=1 Tax=Tortispora caseinolytica NRRL Y-17796 TaxID=767744 RepID=A0A1E4THS6_9ASCO|nr:hypothetical protein CANCADRAFT_122182 [Tortispora caseinolytica NRRL Y-17796]
MLEINPPPTKKLKALRTDLDYRYGMIEFGVSIFICIVFVLFTLNTRRPRPFLFLFVLFIATIVLLFIDLHNRYLFLTKKAGDIAAALFPAAVLMTLRIPIWSSRFHVSYLKYLVLHKWISRLMFLISLLHGLLYTGYYVYEKTPNTLLELSNLLGIVAFFLMLVMVITSLRFFRDRWHGLFYLVHYPFAIATTIVLFFHPHHNRPTVFMSICSAFLGIQKIITVLGTRFIPRNVIPLALTSSVMMLKLPRELLPRTFVPGSHIRISRGHSHNNLFKRYCTVIMTILFPFESHPFTVASLPEDNHVLLFVRRVPGKWTDKLDYRPLMLIGPFPDTAMGLHSHASDILFVVGGIGITFAAPLVRDFVAKRKTVHLMWQINRMSDCQMLEELNLPLQDVDFVFEIYFSASTTAKEETLALELEQFDESSDKTSSQYKLLRKRIDIMRSVHNFSCIGPNVNRSRWVVACGPHRMVNFCDKAARKHRLCFHKELFEI